MKILLTGPNGLLGRNLLNHLINRGHKINIITRNRESSNFKESKNINVYEHNLSNDKLDLSNAFAGVNAVYHCAAELNDTNIMYKLHVNGTNKLVDEFLKTQSCQHFIHVSSVGVYGFPTEGLIKENYDLAYTNEYERTKLIADKLVFNKISKSSKLYTILRPGPILSPEMKNNYIFSMMKFIDKGIFFFINNASSNFNYIYLDDVISTLIRILNLQDQSKNKIFNICNTIKLNDLVNIIQLKLKKKKIKKFPIIPKKLINPISFLLSFIPNFPLNAGRVKVLTNESIFCSDKIKNELGIKNFSNIDLIIEKFLITQENKK